MAGTLPGMILADNGADVVKVEPPGGDTGRTCEGSRMWNRGKRSVVLDLHRRADRDTALELAAAADVVVESFRPGVAERLGVGWHDLRAANPRLVCCSISGFGPAGAYAAVPGYESVVAAVSGHMVGLDVLSGAGCVVTAATDFTTELWRKLMVNALAGFMVLSGRRSGMFRRDDVAGLSRAYVAECLAVARAEGAALGDGAIDEMVGMFGRAPEDMGTSMLFDRQAQRPLEWDIRNGVILRKARRHGLGTPVSEVIVPLLAAASDGPG